MAIFNSKLLNYQRGTHITIEILLVTWPDSSATRSSAKASAEGRAPGTGGEKKVAPGGSSLVK